MNAPTNLKNFIGVCSGLQCPIIQCSGPLDHSPPLRRRDSTMWPVPNS